MANGGERDSNMCQFFFTLGSCEWLKGKHTIFGKVTGNTIFNLLTVSNLETDPANDRPLDPPTLKSVEVLVSPYDDIVARAAVSIFVYSHHFMTEFFTNLIMFYICCLKGAVGGGSSSCSGRWEEA